MFVTYEMQWTVRYFLHRSGKWTPPQQSSMGTDDGSAHAGHTLVIGSAGHIQNLSAGAKAYANRQHTTWHRFALTADQAFQSANSNYYSPMR
jgi:hypothetical protein